MNVCYNINKEKVKEKTAIMKRLISLILLCSLLMVCLAGCTISDNGENAQSSESENKTGEEMPKETPKETEDDKEQSELQEYFDRLEADAATNDKMEFSLQMEEIHNEAKESGLYNDSEWTTPIIDIYIFCDYKKASDEDWYKQSEPYLVSINDAFYEQYRSGLQHGYRRDDTADTISLGLHLYYFSAEDLFADYQTIKSMTDLNYVTGVKIIYSFEIPKELLNAPQ